MMFIIHYNDGGVPYSDFDLLKIAQQYANQYKENQEKNLYVSTGNIIEAVRVMVSRGEIPYQEVEVHFNGEIITLNQYAEFSTWPKGFMDHERKFLREMLENRRSLSKKQENTEGNNE